MHTLVVLAAACCIAAAVVAVSKALGFLLRCLRANRQYSAVPVPGPPVVNKFLGHIPLMLGPRSYWKAAEWTNQYGPIYKMQFLDNWSVVVTDPDAIATVTRRTGPSYAPKPTELYKVMEAAYHPARPNIVSSADDAYWKAVRQAAAPCFSASNLKKVVPLVLELSQRVCDHMAASQSSSLLFDVADAAKRITSDVMGHLLYGEDLRGTYWEPSEYLEVLYPSLQAQSELFVNPFHLWMLWSPSVRHQRYCLARHNQLIGDKVRRLMKEPPASHTIAAHLLSAVDPSTGKPLDANQLKAEVSTFMLAGFETTSHGISWTLTLLAAFPEVQAQVFAELQAAGLAPNGPGEPGRAFDASDLGRLPLLSAVIKESLRLCHPVPFGGIRQVVQEGGTEICGYRLPKGTLLMLQLAPYGLSKHNYGPDVLDFKPSRWMTDSSSTTLDLAAGMAPIEGPEVSVSAAAAAAAAAGSGGGVKGSPPDPITFLTGARDCIGQNLAKLELQVVLATLLSRFTFSPGPDLEAELKLAAATGQPAAVAVHNLAGAYITLQPLKGHMMLRVTPRE